MVVYSGVVVYSDVVMCNSVVVFSCVHYCSDGVMEVQGGVVPRPVYSV